MRASVSTDDAVRMAYETDASGVHLRPDAVARPSSEEEVVELLREAHADRISVTPAGGQTSTTGASITDRGMLLSLRALDAILDLDPRANTIRVQPGVLVADVKRAAAHEGLLFAPDPTSEEECTVGGAIACNASGARTLKYGATRAHVRALRVALANGDVVEVRRPALEKNTAGYLITHDLVDWFVGSEGTLGVILEAELALLPLPARVAGIAIPFMEEADALAFVVSARESGAVAPRCLEYFDALAFDIARSADDQPGWARDAEELRAIEAVVDETVRRVIAMGGTVAAEHGIGKLKRRWLALQLTPLQIAMQHAIKQALDPLGLLAPGNIV